MVRATEKGIVTNLYFMGLKRLFSICLLGSSMLANAVVTHMTVELNSGSKINFLLDDNPVITFEKEKYDIKASKMVVNGDAETSYAIDDVKIYYFTNGDSTPVKSIEAIDEILVSLSKSAICIQNAKAGEKVTLININGSVVASSVADTNGQSTLDLPQTKGVYIVVVGNQSFKIIRN